MEISASLSDEAVRAYYKNLADPACCVRRLVVRTNPSEELLQAIEANHSIATLHIHAHLSEANVARVIKHKDLHVLTVNGTLFELNHSREHGIVPARIPYGELAVWNGRTAFVTLDAEPFLATAAKFSTLNFFVSDTTPALVQTLFDRFATFPKLSKLWIGIGENEASAPVYWTEATKFVRNSTSIRKFGVRYEGRNQSAMHDLIREMAHNTTVTHLSIACNTTTEETCREIAAMLRTNTHLKRFKLETIYSFEGETSTIADALKANKTLKKIALLGCGDCYDYLTALLENSSITSFKSDSWNCLVKHCRVMALILERNIIQAIEIPMRFAVDEPEVLQALKSNTSLRKLHLNMALHLLFAEKRLMSVQFATFNLERLNRAIEMFNLSPQRCFYMEFGFDEEMALISTVNELLAQKIRTRTMLLRFWAVFALQTLQLFTARDLGLLGTVPAEVRRLIVHSVVPAYVMNDRQFAFIANFASREKLQELVHIHRAMDLSAYDDLVENFLYNLLLLV